MRQVTAIPGALLRYFQGYEFEILEIQYQSNRYAKYFTGS